MYCSRSFQTLSRNNVSHSVSHLSSQHLSGTDEPPKKKIVYITAYMTKMLSLVKISLLPLLPFPLKKNYLRHYCSTTQYSYIYNFTLSSTKLLIDYLKQMYYFFLLLIVLKTSIYTYYLLYICE